MTRQQLLEDLLLKLFTPAELRRWLRGRNDDGARLVDALPEDGADPADLAHQAVRALVRFGQVDEDFFRELTGERPRRRMEVREVEQAWNGAERLARRRLGVGLALLGLVLGIGWLAVRAREAGPEAATSTTPTDPPATASISAQVSASPPPIPTPAPDSAPVPAPHPEAPQPPIRVTTPQAPSQTPMLAGAVSDSRVNISGSTVHAGRDANLRGQRVNVEKSDVSADQDVNIGASP